MTAEELLGFTGPDPGAGTFEVRWLLGRLRSAHPSQVKLYDVEQRVAALEALNSSDAQRHFANGLIFPAREFFEINGEFTYWPDASLKSSQILSAPEKSNENPRLMDQTALWNGIYFGGLIHKYLSRKDSDTLKQLAKSAEGLYKLAHITGTPGAVAANSISLEMIEATEAKAGETDVKEMHLLPDSTSKNKDYHHFYYSNAREVVPRFRHLSHAIAEDRGVPKLAKSPVAQQLNPSHLDYGSAYFFSPPSTQALSGILFGVANGMYWLEEKSLEKNSVNPTIEDRLTLQALKDTLFQIAVDVYQHLEEEQWKLRDPLDADRKLEIKPVPGPLRVATTLLYRRALMNMYPDVYKKKNPGFQIEDESHTKSRWNDLVEVFKKSNEIKDFLPLTLEFPNAELARAEWKQTQDYSLWNERALWLYSIVLLDAPHSDFTLSNPEGWPLATIEKESTNLRNRRWLDFGNKTWVPTFSRSPNSWFVYLFNSMRRIVLERHVESEKLEMALRDENIYALSSSVLNSVQPDSGVSLPGFPSLGQVLFHDVSSPTLGFHLPEAHFLLKSESISSIRKHPPPCQILDSMTQERCKVRTLDPIFPPHLMGYSNFHFAENPILAPEKLELSEDLGKLESAPIALPTLYWLAKTSGQLDYQFDGFDPSLFTPPGDASDSSEDLQKSTPREAKILAKNNHPTLPISSSERRNRPVNPSCIAWTSFRSPSAKEEDNPWECIP